MGDDVGAGQLLEIRRCGRCGRKGRKSFRANRTREKRAPAQQEDAMKALRLSPMPRSRIARLYPPCVRPLLRGVALAERPRSARAGSMPHSPIPARICPVCGAGLDVRKMQITVSVRLPAPSGGEPQVESQTFGSGQRSREARGSALRRKALAPAQPSIASDESYIDKPSRERVDRRGCGKSDPAARIQIPTIGGRGSIGDVRRHAGQAFPSAPPPA